MNYEIVRKRNKIIIHFSEESMLKNIRLNNDNTINLSGDLYDILYDILEDADIVFNIKQASEETRTIKIISESKISLIGQTLTIEYYRYSQSNHD